MKESYLAFTKRKYPIGPYSNSGGSVSNESSPLSKKITTIPSNAFNNNSAQRVSYTKDKVAKNFHVASSKNNNSSSYFKNTPAKRCKGLSINLRYKYPLNNLLDERSKSTVKDYFETEGPKSHKRFSSDYSFLNKRPYHKPMQLVENSKLKNTEATINAYSEGARMNIIYTENPAYKLCTIGKSQPDTAKQSTQSTLRSITKRTSFEKSGVEKYKIEYKPESYLNLRIAKKSKRVRLMVLRPKYYSKRPTLKDVSTKLKDLLSGSYTGERTSDDQSREQFLKMLLHRNKGKIVLEKEDISFKKAVNNVIDPRRKEDIEETAKKIKSFWQKYNSPPETTIDFYKIGKVLGKGAFGKVNLGIHKLSGKLVAIKSIEKQIMKDEPSKNKVMKEVAIWEKLAHPSIIR